MSKRISTDQIGELLAQDKVGRVTKQNLQSFLFNPDRFNTYPVTIGVGLGVEELVKRGSYDRNCLELIRDCQISSSFQVVNLQLVFAPGCVFGEHALGLFDKKALRTATIEESLMFGMMYPELQRRAILICLERIFEDTGRGRGVLALWGDKDHRYLAPEHYDAGFLNCYFLAASDEDKMITQFKVGDRTYEIVQILDDDEFQIGFDPLIAKAKELGTDLGEDDGGYIIKHQDEIPAGLKKKLGFIFTNWHKGKSKIAIVMPKEGRLAPLFAGTGEFADGFRFLRRLK